MTRAGSAIALVTAAVMYDEIIYVGLVYISVILVFLVVMIVRRKTLRQPKMKIRPV